MSPQKSARSVDVASARKAAIDRYLPTGRSQKGPVVRAEKSVRKSDTDTLR